MISELLLQYILSFLPMIRTKLQEKKLYDTIDIIVHNPDAQREINLIKNL